MARSVAGETGCDLVQPRGQCLLPPKIVLRARAPQQAAVVEVLQPKYEAAP